MLLKCNLDKTLKNFQSDNDKAQLELFTLSSSAFNCFNMRYGRLTVAACLMLRTLY